MAPEVVLLSIQRTSSSTTTGLVGEVVFDFFPILFYARRAVPKGQEAQNGAQNPGNPRMAGPMQLQS
jgi:hypothetical protein